MRAQGGDSGEGGEGGEGEWLMPKGMHATINPTLTLTLSQINPTGQVSITNLSLPAGAASSSPMAKRREARTTLIAFFQDSRAYNMGTCVRAWVGVRVCAREREKERERE